MQFNKKPTNIINFPGSLKNSASQLPQVPLIQQALFILNQALETDIKLTETGAINRALVKKFWDSFGDYRGNDIFKPHNELSCGELVCIRFILEERKYLKKSKKHLFLTQKAKATLLQNSFIDLYRDIFSTMIGEWDWSYRDRYPSYDFIQENCLDLIDVLLNWPSNIISPFDVFCEAFAITSDVKSKLGDLKRGKNPFEDFSPEDEILRCLRTRFFERVCVPLGLLEEQSFEVKLKSDPMRPFQITDFLRNELIGIFR